MSVQNLSFKDLELDQYLNENNYDEWKHDYE